jgi:hypothetical protein
MMLVTLAIMVIAGLHATSPVLPDLRRPPNDPELSGKPEFRGIHSLRNNFLRRKWPPRSGPAGRRWVGEPWIKIIGICVSLIVIRG